MKLTQAMAERLTFLARVTEKECVHLQSTDARLFADAFTEDVARAVASDPVLAERLDAFVSRFGRLQDTVGDKLLPAVLGGLGESVGAAIDNLDRAEKLGLLASADAWLEMRRLRNQMVHEYIEDLVVLASALRAAHGFCHGPINADNEIGPRAPISNRNHDDSPVPTPSHQSAQASPAGF